MGDRETRGNRRQPTGESRWPRVCYASAVAVMVLGTFASFGGISYAASSSGRVAHTVQKVATGKHIVHSSSASSDQYNQTPTVKPQVQVKAVHASVKPSTKVAVGPAKTTGTLPFTGFSLVGTLLLGLALIAAGTVLRVRERRARG